MLDKLFSGGKHNLPITLGKDDMKAGVGTMLTEYINDLEANGADKEVVGRVKSFRKSCAITLRNYFKGIHSRAYYNFTKAVTRLGIDKSPLLSSELGNEPLFRGRVNDRTADFTNAEMFHIPLNKRGVVTSQRYSFPGLPCLYLASSAYTCWMEMGQPSLDSFQVAALRPTDPTAKVIDLSRVPQQLNALRHKTWFSAEDYLLYWPLLAVCSIKVRNEDDSFKPEYIFPQFYLEHIQQRTNEHVGIRFASNKCERQLKGDWHTYTNYVFPTSTGNMNAKDDARLKALFDITRNRSGKELQILSSVQRMDWAKTEVDPKPTETTQILNNLKPRRIVSSDGKEYPYSISPFGMIELALLRDNFDIDETRTSIGGLSEEDVKEILQDR